MVRQMSCVMNPLQAQETAERDQLWASLRALRSEIDRLATGEFDGSERQQQLVLVLARIVAAEMTFRTRESNSE
jgi:hypothetical protein